MKLEWKKTGDTFKAIGGNAVYPSEFTVEKTPEGRFVAFENGKFKGIHPNASMARSECQRVHNYIESKTPLHLKMN